MDRHEERSAKEMGHDKKPPIIQFYDHAIPDPEATKRSGRPRFRSAVYIQKIPSAEDLIVRDVFSRKAEDQDKTDYPEQWAQYLERKANIDNKNPLVTGLPGMTITAQYELRELGIFTCRQFVEYDGNLDDLEPLREIAREVLAIGNASRPSAARAGNLRQGRDVVQNGVERPPHLSAKAGGASAGSQTNGSAKKESHQKARQQEKGGEEEVETFRYATEVMYQWH